MHKAIIGAGDPYLLYLMWIKYLILQSNREEWSWFTGICEENGITGELYSVALWIYVKYYGVLDMKDDHLFCREIRKLLPVYGSYDKLIDALAEITVRLQRQSRAKEESCKKIPGRHILNTRSA